MANVLLFKLNFIIDDAPSPNITIPELTPRDVHVLAQHARQLPLTFVCGSRNSHANKQPFVASV